MQVMKGLDINESGRILQRTRGIYRFLEGKIGRKRKEKQVQQVRKNGEDAIMSSPTLFLLLKHKLKTMIARCMHSSISEEDNGQLREKSIIVQSFRSGVGDVMESPDSWDTLGKIADLHQKELDVMITEMCKKYKIDSNTNQIWTDGTIRPIRGVKS